MNSAGETATVLVLLVFMAGVGAALVMAMEADRERGAERRCAQQNNVHACEKVVTWKPMEDRDADE